MSLSSGLTIWFTGLSGAGKTTIGTYLEGNLKSMGLRVVSLDGDVLRKGLNKDLGFSDKDRSENIRRTAYFASMFAGNGFITIVTLISPFEKDRETARQIHKDKGIPFFEVFIDTPIEVCKLRDVKGLYHLAKENKIKDMTGVQSTYEAPLHAEVKFDTQDKTVEECGRIILDFIENNFISLSGEDGTIRELFSEDKWEGIQKSIGEEIVKIEIKTIDTQWLQVLAEGWATPLTGFMREDQYLQCLHFSMIKEAWSNCWHIMPIPIVLAINEEKKREIDGSSRSTVALEYGGKILAVMENIEIYPHRSHERCSRVFAIDSDAHPSIKMINESGPWLIGGDLKVFERIRWNDGLDAYRLTPREIRDKLKALKCEAACAFQLRNPIHNGHALLMRKTVDMLKEKKFNNPMLLLHPLGGWTKDDDVPLSVRIKQHEAVLESGELKRQETILAIFPSPMSYAGPTEVLWHCKARMVCGINYYIVGRDPAGIPHPEIKGIDLYDGSHGRKILGMAPHLEKLNIIPFTTVAYDKTVKRMEIFEEKRKEDFEFISGTMMRNIARKGGEMPEGFMVKGAWKIISEYYQSLK